MKKAIIGLMPLWDSEKNSYWMIPGYEEGIMTVGGIPVILPMTKDIAALEQLEDVCDGFLFTGGQDVSPLLYGEEKLPECGEICETRDFMEKKILAYAIKHDKAVLGICRGIQIINAALGGTLYQDLPSQFKSSCSHHQTPPYDKPVHSVSLQENTPLMELVNKKSIRVNSYHHQAVKDLAKELTVMAYSEDALVEAIYMPSRKFIWAVQWHPELSYKSDDDSKKIFRAFVQAAESHV